MANSKMDEKQREDKIGVLLNLAKPCPFCGSEDVWFTGKGTRYGRIAYIRCDLCGAQTKAITTKESWDVDACERLIGFWNRRAKNETD